MKYLLNFILLLPLLFLIIEIFLFSEIGQKTRISPLPLVNQKLTELNNALQLSGLKFQQIQIYDHRSEVEFSIINPPNHSFTTIVSLHKSALSQVGALQKLIKIANIEGRDINFVDLSSNRPYATF